MQLTPATKEFIVHWGEMGARWGVNRAVAQIHALLYVSPQPLTAEAISETLSLARSTVSVSLRELQNWGIVKVIHVLGDRRDHFETIGDVWEMLLAVIDERKHREIDPTVRVLRRTVDELEASTEEDPYTRERIVDMLDFFETVVGVYEQVQKLPMETIVKIAKMRGVVVKLLSMASEKEKEVEH